MSVFSNLYIDITYVIYMVHPKSAKKWLIKLYTKSIQKHRKYRQKSRRGRFCEGGGGTMVPPSQDLPFLAFPVLQNNVFPGKITFFLRRLVALHLNSRFKVPIPVYLWKHYLFSQKTSCPAAKFKIQDAYTNLGRGRVNNHKTKKPKNQRFPHYNNKCAYS